MQPQAIKELKEILKKYNPEYTSGEVVNIGQKILELYQIILTNQKTNEQ